MHIIHGLIYFGIQKRKQSGYTEVKTETGTETDNDSDINIYVDRITITVDLTVITLQ